MKWWLTGWAKARMAAGSLTRITRHVCTVFVLISRTNELLSTFVGMANVLSLLRV